MKKHSFRRATKRGFTLIELLVVVVIIGILAAVATPIYLNQRKAAWKATAVSDATNAALAIETARVQNGGTLNGVRFATGVDGKPMLITVGGASAPAPASASVPTPTAAAPDTLTTSGWATGDGGVGWQAVLGSDRFLVSGVPATVIDTPDPQLDLADDTVPSIRFATSDQLSSGEMTTMAADADFESTVSGGRMTLKFRTDSPTVRAAIARAKLGDLTLQIVLTTRPMAPRAGAVYTNRVEATGSAPASATYEWPASPASGDAMKSPVSPGNTETAWVGKDSAGQECYAVMTTNKNVDNWAAVRTSAGLTTGTPPAIGSAECPKPGA